MHTTPPSLLERLRRPGEDPAWEQFVSLYTPFIFSLARRAGLNRDDAADLVQDVFLLLSQKMADFQYDAAQSFRAWLRTVVVNRLHESTRRRSIATISEVDQFYRAEPDVAAAFEEAEYRRHIIAQAMELMQREFSQSTWKACWEHVVSGRTAIEVGAELGISEGAVYVAKCRVLRRLRTELKGLL